MTKHEAIPYVEHIRDAIAYIESFTKNLTKEKFLSDRLRQNAVIRELEIIGEATKNTPENFRKKYPNVEWKEMARTRDKIIHGYSEVDLEIVWNIIKKDIPDLKKKIKSILSDIEQRDK
ncbi:MAG: DUF86 domain-containing protein [Nanoarchaeota archaeon]